MLEQTSEINYSKFCCICGEEHFYKQCTFIAITNSIDDKKVLSRARASLPDALEIKTLADGAPSVYAREDIPMGTEFGPFQAQKSMTLKPEITFPLKLFSCDETEMSEYFLDTTDEEKCNWMMFVCPASDVTEQNMISYQNGAGVFYAAFKDIPAGHPLYIWYSPQYALKMDKHILRAKNNKISVGQKQEEDVEMLVRRQQKIIARETWNCKFCYKLEKNAVNFANHLIQHYNATLKKHCEVCGATFTYQKDLKKHFKWVHSNHVLSQTLHSNKLEPDVGQNTAEKIISDKKEEPKEPSLGGPLLLNNIFSDSLDNSNLLKQTEEPSNNMDIYKIENLSSFLGDNLTTDIINENVKDLDHFNFELKEDAEEVLTCDLCLKQCSSLKAIISHLVLHTGKYRCNQCNKIFGRKESINLHQCNRNFVIKCDLCNKIFYAKKYLARHITVIHNKKFTCDRCAKYFHSTDALTHHNCDALSDGEKNNYHCHACEKVFLSKITLRRHIQSVHEGYKPPSVVEQYVCPICTKVIKGQFNCSRHMKSHEPAEHECNICNKKFVRSDILKQHKKLVHFNHLKDNKFKCDQCASEFKTKSLLNQHVTTHKNIKRFECLKCALSFKRKRNLTRHNTSLHEGKRNHNLGDFECPVCFKNFKLSTSLKRHVRKLHPDEHKSFILNTNKKSKKLHIPIIEDSNKSYDTDQKCRDLKETIENMDFMTNVNSCSENNGTETIDEFLKENIDIVENLLGSSKHLDDKIDDVQEQAREICLSLPDLTETDQEIRLSETAYIMENGTIVEPSAENPSNVVLYILNNTK